MLDTLRPPPPRLDKHFAALVSIARSTGMQCGTRVWLSKPKRKPQTAAPTVQTAA